MGWMARLLRSSIGAKAVMALSGILLFAFVVAHLLGNLQIFGGPERINGYSQALRDLGPLLWAARIGLLALAVVHVFTALRLVKLNEAARPVPYVARASRQVKLQTRAMWTTGLLLLAYVLYHLAHFTWGWVQPRHFGRETRLTDGRVVGDVYSMMVHGFRVWWVSASYLAAMAVLALHLSHGIPSFFQTLGLHHEKYERALAALGPAVAALVFAGYASIPVAIWCGLVLPPGAAP
jgi:succinate dehydrogenase / fumarate reductase cytochrome b subunit